MILQTAILSLISVLGLYVGLILGFIAPEEVKPLNKYFTYGAWVMSIGVFISLLFSISAILSIIIVIGFFAWLFFIKKSYLTIELLAVSIPFFIGLANANALVSALLFLCGFPLGTLMITKQVKKDKLTKKKSELVKNLLQKTKYFIPSFILVLIILSLLN